MLCKIPKAVIVQTRPGGGETGSENQSNHQAEAQHAGQILVHEFSDSESGFRDSLTISHSPLRWKGVYGVVVAIPLLTVRTVIIQRGPAARDSD